MSEFKPLLITGGKGDGPYQGHNWLGKLSANTVFLFRPRSKPNGVMHDFGVQRAIVVYQYESSTQLYDDLNNKVSYIVDSADFSTVMKPVQILFTPEKQDEETTVGPELVVHSQESPS